MGERPFFAVLIKLQLKTDIMSLGHWGVAFSSVIAPFPEVMPGSACVPAPPPRVEFSFSPLFPCTSFSEFPPAPSDCFLVLMLNVFFLREMSEMEFQRVAVVLIIWKLSP